MVGAVEGEDGEDYVVSIFSLTGCFLGCFLTLTWDFRPRVDKMALEIETPLYDNSLLSLYELNETVSLVV